MAEAPFAPAREQVAAWQHALGRARDEARRLPDAFVWRRFERALEAIARDFRRVEEAEDVDAALLEALEGARRDLARARALLDPLRSARGAVERTFKVLDAIDKALAEARLPTADAASFSGEKRDGPALDALMRASPGAPRCFAIDRQVIVPGSRTRIEPEPEDVDPAQAWRVFPPVDAAPPEAIALRTAPEPVERARLQAVHVLEAAFAELGALGWLRRSRDGDVWYQGTQSFEERLLAQLDAVVASGRPLSVAVPTPEGWRHERVAIDLPRILLRWSEDAVPGDTSRAFCRALVLGCLRGADSARVAVAALDAPTGLDARAAVEALALASSADVDEALQQACALPRLAAAAFEVARRRGTVDPAAAAAALASADEKLARAAARALGTAADRQLAIGVLEHALERGLEASVEVAAVESLLRLGEPAALRIVRERARALPADDRLLTRWLQLLALSPDRADAQVLQQRAGEDIERLEAWGHAGRIELAEALLERIAAHGKGITPRAHLAIFERISGVVAPEPFDPRGLREAWRAPDAQVRYRRGRPLSLEVALEELATFGRVQRERRFVSLEVAFLSSGAVRIDPDDWVARQLERIAAARRGPLVAQL